MKSWSNSQLTLPAQGAARVPDLQVRIVVPAKQWWKRKATEVNVVRVKAIPRLCSPERSCTGIAMTPQMLTNAPFRKLSEAGAARGEAWTVSDIIIRSFPYYFSPCPFGSGYHANTLVKGKSLQDSKIRELEWGILSY